MSVMFHICLKVNKNYQEGKYSWLGFAVFIRFIDSISLKHDSINAMLLRRVYMIKPVRISKFNLYF